MLFYYGADAIVEKPAYNSERSNPSNDYGKGFYLTPDIDMARLWASRYDKGYCITYEVETEKLKSIVLDESNDNSILKWITLLVQHRFSKDEYEANKDTIDWLIEHYPTDMTDVDVIIGYRADDAYFSYSRDFVQNRLSLQALSEAMRLGKLGTQYVLKSVKAFNSISIVDYENVKQTDDYDIFRKSTLKEFHHIKESDSIDNTFIRDIMRGNR